MAIGAFVPLVFFVVILASVGFRLIRLWRRTREIPELSLGLGLLVVSSSLPLAAVGRAPATAMELAGRVSFSAGITAAAVGVSLLVFFNYWVFRRGSSWGRAAFIAICLTMCAGVGYMSAANFLGESIEQIKITMRPGALALMLTILACFAWSGAESLRYHTALRRRLSIGLGDPVLTNRFLLWGVAGLTCSILLVVITACIMMGMTILHEPLPLTAIAACGTIMSASWYLTFFAPESYRRFLCERAAQNS
jgi:hypothetical protein